MVTVRFLLFLLALVLTTGSLAQTVTFSLPAMGDASQQYFSPGEEVRLGRSIIEELRDKGRLIQDVQLTEYLNGLGQRLATFAGPMDHPLHFYWLDSGGINAFAAPGGFIGVNAGLLLATRNEEELAGVVAHEIAHVAQRHISQSIADQRRLAIPTMAAMMAGALLAATADANLGEAAMLGTAAASTQRRISFTRANEQEADRLGAQILARAGFDPNGLASFFSRLQRQQGNSADLQEYMLTHPLPLSRVADTQDRLVQNPGYRGPQDTQAYALARSRMRVLSADNGHQLLRYFEEWLQSGDGDNELANRYGYALALKRNGRFAEAAEQIARLRRQAPNRLAFRLEEADIALAAGNSAQAWELYRAAEQLYPDDYTLAMHHGQALATQGDPQQALRLLRPLLQRRSDDSAAFAIHAQAARRAGDRALTHASLAEYYYLTGKLKMALEQAELGLGQADIKPHLQDQLRSRMVVIRRELEKEQD